MQAWLSEWYNWPFLFLIALGGLIHERHTRKCPIPGILKALAK